jgi:penicillin amidase
VDPASGVLATANARIVPDDYPYAVSNDWVDPYRAERIYKLLDGKLLGGRSGLTPPDMLAIQNDVHSDFELVLAQRLAYALDHATTSSLGSNAKRLHQAADLLRSWNGELSPDSAAAAIVTSTRSELWPTLLTAQIRKHDGCSEKQATTLALLYTWGERNTALELLLQHTPERWLPDGYHSWNDFLAAAVLHALQHDHAPADLTHWSYGAVHPVEIAHPIFGSHSAVSRLLGVSTGTGLHAAGGDATTPKAIGLHFGPSERFTADLSNAEATVGNITTGQSGNPKSPWFLDQFLPWLKGITLPLQLEHPATVHTLTLQP